GYLFPDSPAGSQSRSVPDAIQAGAVDRASGTNDAEICGPVVKAKVNFQLIAVLLQVGLWYSAECSLPPGCKPPELLISREHPLIILYGPGSGELILKCWENLQADIKPYCAVTMDPTSLDVKERLEGWRRMLRVVQPHNIPIVL